MKIHKILISIIICIIISISLAGCSSNNEPLKIDNTVGGTQNFPMEFIDGIGNTITINAKPERIISLAPSHTEILYALGLGDKVVGVTQFCDYPEEVKNKPIIGDSFSINLEKIVSLEPDLVIEYWGMNDELKKQLENAGIALVTFSPESISQIQDTIIKIGVATGTSEKAEEIVLSIKNKQIEITNKVKDAPPVKVFYEIEYSSALWTAGKGSFIDEIITLGGGQNVAADAVGAYAQYSVEALLEKDPQVYVTNTFNMGLQNYNDIKDRPGFNGITAVREGRIEILDGNILSRPSHRVVEALELMAKAIHPELFK